MTLKTRIACLLHAIGRVLQPRLNSLERRIEQLEKSPLEYSGVFEAGRTYRRGQLTTRQGSIWFCNSETASRPGDDDSWTLACKRGRDARNDN